MATAVAICSLSFHLGSPAPGMREHTPANGGHLLHAGWSPDRACHRRQTDGQCPAHHLEAGGGGNGLLLLPVPPACSWAGTGGEDVPHLLLSQRHLPLRPRAPHRKLGTAWVTSRGLSGPSSTKETYEQTKLPQLAEPSSAKTQSANWSEENYELLTLRLNDCCVSVTRSRVSVREMKQREQTRLLIPPSR